MPSETRLEKYILLTAIVLSLVVLAFLSIHRLSSITGFVINQTPQTVKQNSISPTPQPESMAFFKNRQKKLELFTLQLEKTVYEKDPTVALSQLHAAASDNFFLSHCHTLGHTIGNAAMKKYQDINTALRFSDEFCGSGYIHGVVEAAIGDSKDLYHDLITMCPEDSGNCFHGIGHGLMYFTENDIPKSLSYCDVLSATRAKQFCSEGVFMENFNTEMLSHSTIYLKPDDTTYPCALQKDFYKGACYFYAPDYYLQLHPNDYSGAFAVCKSVEDKFIPTCINGTASRMTKRNLLEPKVIEAQCMKLESQYQKNCIDGMVSYYVVNYYSLAKGRTLCDQLLEENKPQCLASVTARKTLFPE